MSKDMGKPEVDYYRMTCVGKDQQRISVSRCPCSVAWVLVFDKEDFEAYL